MSTSGFSRRARHRRGVAVTEVQPRRWDLAERATAQYLDQIEPAWSIWYGIGARQFYAAASSGVAISRLPC
ncbi:hypothetical protein AB0O34_07760 [Sphaerisporangium sp. NPDC088356]|uniref:hypothetical protein n=1 Tax=Sphaerisporangium sp. NPDC088356 TaxID=3154871 RepID=UPI003434C85A